MSDYSRFEHFDAKGNRDITADLTGQVTVSADNDGVYTIKATAVGSDGNTYDLTYTGRLPFFDPTASYYVLRQIMEDRENETFKGGMGFYYGDILQTSKGGEMMVQLYSDDFNDENGMQYDETTMICLDLIGRPFPNGNPTLDPGTYSIKPYYEGVRGDAIAGREMTYMSQTMGIGCYLRDRSSSKYASSDPYAYAYLQSGDIVIEKTDKGFRISLENGVTTLGYKVSFVYEGGISPFLDYSEDDRGTAKSTIVDDVDLKLDDLPLARLYNGGVVNGYQTYLFDVGSRSGMDEQRKYGGDIIRFHFVNRPGTPVVDAGEYTVMEEPYETYYMPGKLAQTHWVGTPGGGTDISGTCYIHFEEGRFLVMDHYAWFREGNVKVAIDGTPGPGNYDKLTYTVDIDLTSDNNFYVSGSWTGPVTLMYDPDSLSAIGSVEADGSEAKLFAVGNGLYQVSDYLGSVEVYNMMGSLCGTFNAAQTIDLSAAAPGMYIFKMGKTTVKVIK